MTSMTESDSSSASTLIKTDALGRMRTSPERREMLLREFEHSGMSGAEFATMIGINYTPLTHMTSITTMNGGGVVDAYIDYAEMTIAPIARASTPLRSRGVGGTELLHITATSA